MGCQSRVGESQTIFQRETHIGSSRIRLLWVAPGLDGQSRRIPVEHVYRISFSWVEHAVPLGYTASSPCTTTASIAATALPVDA
jgi:hypothetical protein